MYNVLLHSLHNITAIWEHPKTEYKLVLKLEGHSSTVKNVQDSERNVIDKYIMNYPTSHASIVHTHVHVHVHVHCMCITCYTMYMICNISMFHNYDHADTCTCTLRALQNPTNMPLPLHCMLTKWEVLMTGLVIISCNDHYQLMNTTWAHGHCTFSCY